MVTYTVTLKKIIEYMIEIFKEQAVVGYTTETRAEM